jgi:hypothetical protein
MMVDCAMVLHTASPAARPDRPVATLPQLSSLLYNYRYAYILTFEAGCRLPK